MELKRLLQQYESGTYGLGEAIAELRDGREQLRIRDQQVEEFVQQLNYLETKMEDLLLENEALRLFARHSNSRWAQTHKLSLGESSARIRTSLT